MFFIVKSTVSSPYSSFNDEKPSMTFVADVTTKNENRGSSKGFLKERT
ncbi:hypothetical protein J2Z66_006485, partial [Paenibacillus eucommiae]|nr:hypothetical protein [Paenibacillus eucommiae]